MSFRFLSVPLAILLLQSCSATGFHRDELHSALNSGPAAVDDAEIAHALAQKPQLPKPFSIGVYFQEGEGHAGQWRFTRQDKDKILASAKKLQDTGEISNVFELSSSLTSGAHDLKALRLAAAKHGADALLVVGGAKDVDFHVNKWGWTYLGIVTTAFVPGTVTDVLFITRATLWDVRNQFLYMSAEAEGEKTQTRPALFSDEKEAVTQAKEQSVAELSEQIAKMAERLTAAQTAKTRNKMGKNVPMPKQSRTNTGRLEKRQARAIPIAAVKIIPTPVATAAQSNAAE